LAFRAGEQALAHTSHGVGLLLYYKQLVARAGRNSSSCLSQPELAAQAGVTVRTIRRYDDHLVDAGLIWLKKEGHNYRRTITAYEPVPPVQASIDDTPETRPPEVEVRAVEPNPFFCCSQCGQVAPPDADRSGAPHPLTGSRVNQDEALRPGGELVTQTETVELLRAEKVHPATVRAFAHLDPAYVREQIDAAWRCGRGREMPNFLVGCLRTGGVYGSSSGGGSRPAPAPPAFPLGTDDCSKYENAAALYAMRCLTCWGVILSEWEGHCPRCEPELFEPVGGQ
jgi:hypothetical protein